MSCWICGAPTSRSTCRSSASWPWRRSPGSTPAAAWPCWWGAAASISRPSPRGWNHRGCRPSPALRAQLTALGQPTCHQLLSQADPEAAARIAPADAVRTQRALEVLYASGQPLSSQQSRNPPPWRVLELGLNPADLHQRIARRTGLLYDAGLVAETERLIGRYGSTLPLLDTIGYGEARSLLQGSLSEAEARALTEQRTRQFAKRQRTWFRRQHQPHWLGQADQAGDLPQQARQTIAAVLR